MDNEEISVTLYDVYRMAGYIECPDSVPCLVRLEVELFPGIRIEDCWKQLPTKIMIGDSITYTLIISLDFQRNKAGEYLVQRMSVQEKLLDFFEDIPVGVGLGVASNVADVQ